MNGDGWTLWLDMLAEEHNYRHVLLRGGSKAAFSRPLADPLEQGDTLPIYPDDTQASFAITDVFELDTEPYRISLDTPVFPTLDFVGEADLYPPLGGQNHDMTLIELEGDDDGFIH